MLLTKEQFKELENIFNNIEISLDSADCPIETETIYNNSIVSLDKLGILPNDMSIEYAQKLVTEREHKSRIVKIFEKLLYKKNGNLVDNENYFWLIARNSKNTIFAGPLPIIIGLRGLSIAFRHLVLFNLLGFLFPDLGEEFDEWFFNSKWFISLCLRYGINGVIGAGLNFLPFKFGAFIIYAWFEQGEEFGYPIPAEGWVKIKDISGNETWEGKFWGGVTGFTGIKIIKGLGNFSYLGTALTVDIEYD